jgi:deoxycytidylate deaminase
MPLCRNFHKHIASLLAMSPSVDAPPPAPEGSTHAGHDASFEDRVAAYRTNVLPADYDFDPAFSLDENYMILALIYARLSVSKRGNMGCIIVEPEPDEVGAPGALADSNGSAAEPPAKRPRVAPDYPSSGSDQSGTYSRYLAHSNNTPLPIPEEANVRITNPRPVKPGKTPRKEVVGQSAFQRFAGFSPEIHAEARAICLAASSTSLSLRGPRTTAYITFPPCKECLPLLLAIGIKRLVYRQTAPLTSKTLCRLAGIECVEFTDREHDDRLKEHVKAWWTARGEGKEETRTRVERWWTEAEQRLSSAAATSSSAGESATGDTTATTTLLPVLESATTESS